MEENFSPERFLTQKDLLEKTLNQIRKDFHSAGVNLSIKFTDISFEGICKAISPEIKRIIEHDHHTFSNLLYRVDLSEQKIKQLLRNSSENNLHFEIAELIVKRELQKVVIREYYKKTEHEDLDP